MPFTTDELTIISKVQQASTRLEKILKEIAVKEESVKKHADALKLATKTLEAKKNDRVNAMKELEDLRNTLISTLQISVAEEKKAGWGTHRRIDSSDQIGRSD